MMKGPGSSVCRGGSVEGREGGSAVASKGCQLRVCAAV